MSPLRLPQQNTIAWVTSTTDTSFLTVLETRSLRMGCHHGWVPVRTSGGLQRAALPLCAHMGERVGQGGERARERLHSHDLI